MGDAATVAVQIVNYRTRRYLERCIETAVADLGGSGPAYEINLLDNASGEDLADLAARFSAVRASVAPSNVGFGGGHNLLARETEAPYLLILNPDVELRGPGTIARLLDVVAGDVRVSAAGPKLIMADGRPQPYDHGRLHGARAAIAIKGGHSYWRATDVRQEVAWVSGAAMLVKRAAFMAVGGFDERLFLYKEDEDLCLRMRAAGGVIVYEPGVVMGHHGSVVADRESELTGASSYFFAKHYEGRRSRKAFAAAHQTLAYLRL
ncbi:MAG: glycosyltransferase family 2 protein [Solirubrobacterales bacterium]|nr:glycosyltransferase family 2 protein [Solirubrobacterales bacterium]